MHNMQPLNQNLSSQSDHRQRWTPNTRNPWSQMKKGEGEREREMGSPTKLITHILSYWGMTKPQRPSA